MRLTATLAVVATVLWLAGPVPAQPTSPSTSAPLTVPATPGRPLPVIGTILEHREELGLSAAQVETLQRLSLDLAREAIRRHAELLITHVTLDVLLDQHPGHAIDLAAAEARLREAQTLRTDLQFALIRAVEAAKAELTPEQHSRLAVLLASTAPRSEADSPDDPASAARGAPPGSPGGGASSGGRPSGGGGTASRPPSGGGGARPPAGGGTAVRPPLGGGTAVRPPSGGGGPRPPAGDGTAVRPPSGGGGARPPARDGTALRPPSGGGRPPGAGGKPPGPPPGGAPSHSRPPDRHRDDGRHGGGAIVGVWPSIWWDPWWEPYWYYAPPPRVVVQEPPVYVQQQLDWYYCRSAQAYYPSVPSCPEPWIPVPAARQ